MPSREKSLNVPCCHDRRLSLNIVKALNYYEALEFNWTNLL